MKKYFIFFLIMFASIAAFAQLEVKQNSFKEVPGFVNINLDIQSDDNDVPYAVVKIGDLELTNVRASVVRSQNAPLLLGQSLLGRLGKIEIDNEKRMIRITH